MYFPGDPLLPHDPIFNSIPGPGARARDWIAGFSLDVTEPGWALGFTFDIVLRGSPARRWWIELAARRPRSKTVGPFFDFPASSSRPGEVVACGSSAKDGRLSSRVPPRRRAGAPVPVTRSWRPRRRAPPASYRHPADDRDAPLDPADATASAVSRLTADGRFSFSTVMPWTRRRTGRPLCRRRTCSSASWPGGFSRGWQPGSISRASPRTPTIPFWRTRSGESTQDAHRAPRRLEPVRVRRQAAGTRLETVFFDV